MVKTVFRAVRRVSAVVFALSKLSVSAEGAPTAWGESPMMWEDANQTEASEGQRKNLKG
jgi:hypothetical protein